MCERLINASSSFAHCIALCHWESHGIAYRLLGNNSAAGGTPSQDNAFEVDNFLTLALAGCRFKVDPNDVGLAVFRRVTTDVEDSGTGLSFGEFIGLVAGNSANREVLG